MIHGPGNKGNLNLLYGVVKKGIPWPLGAFENRRTFTSIENIYFTSPEGGEYSIWIIDYSDRSDGTTNYVVRVTVGDQSQQFTGTIDGSSSRQDITSFSYG